MESNKSQISACRLELPRFGFVAVIGLYPSNRADKILTSFSVAELENKVTADSVSEALRNVDQLTK